MAEILVQFDAAIKGADGRAYQARVCGRIGGDGLWDGWIEFVDGSRVLTTETETRQPNRTDLEYWASGLTVAFLEGALRRAQKLPAPHLVRTVEGKPSFEAPARRATSSHLRPRTVLNPFEVYGQGEKLLREQLSALDEDHVRNILRAYHLAPISEVDALKGNRRALVEAVVSEVRKRA